MWLLTRRQGHLRRRSQSRGAGDRCLPRAAGRRTGGPGVPGTVVRFLAAETGIRQFLDLGTGIPAANNTQEVAQRVSADCRIVYVDNDAMVLSHARALLTSTPEGACAYLDADLRNTGSVLKQTADTLDFGQPVAVMLAGVMHLVRDDDDPYRIAAQLMSAVPPGSYLVVSHPASDILEPEMGAMDAIERYNEMVTEHATIRTKPEVTRFFDGLDLLEPGIVPANEWRPDSEAEACARCAAWAGVARKP